MKFVLECTFVLTKKPDAKIDDLIESSKELLQKGAPKGEGAKIENYSLKGDRLDLLITSGRYVRPHDAALRLRKYLATEIGKRYKVGIREIIGKKYTINFKLEKKPLKKFTIPLVNKIDFSGDECTITLENLNEDALQNNYIDRMVKLVNEKVQAQHYEGKKEFWKLLWKSEEKKSTWNKDPSAEMEKRGWIKHRGRGQWIFGPVVTRIIKTFEQLAYEELLKPLGFNEVIIPKAVTWDVWKRSGHAKGIYSEIYYICPPQTRDPEFWDEIIDTYKITGEVPIEKLKEKIKDPIGGVCYAQCPPFWPYLADKIIADSSMPLKVFDRSGTSMRYESGGLHGIERVEEFHRIELIWLGYPDQVKKILDEIVEKYKHIFNEILDLEWRMAWVTPWFMQQEGLKGISEEQNVGTIDFEAYMPYRGSRDSEWLEFQNASNNGSKYPDGFSVKSQKYKDLFSGCSGIGLERWLAAFTAQKGLNPKEWPKEFRKRAGKLPEDIKFL